MKILVLGWYGTETIGDRGILAGLISVFAETFGSFEITIGSLCPFFSSRTIEEDSDFYGQISGFVPDIKIINSSIPRELNRALQCSDLVVMGGGPLMDIDELFMIEYAFAYARKLGIKTALLGCGVGPLSGQKYLESVIRTVQNSDLIILRDSLSQARLADICSHFCARKCDMKIYTAPDPAVKCAIEFGRLNEAFRDNYIAVNLRSFPGEYATASGLEGVNDMLGRFVAQLAEVHHQRSIRLIPMHYFHLGGDDRLFLNRIALQHGTGNIEVQNENLTLAQTMQVFQNAWINVGMRFHSVLFQTVLSGNNYVLDYTEPGKGKICGFIKDIGGQKFYEQRLVSVQQRAVDIGFIRNTDEIFSFDFERVGKSLQIYQDKLKELIK